MSWTVDLALYGWAPATLVFFVLLSARNAAFLSLVVGQLVLPEAGFQVAGWLALNKPAVIGMALLLSVLVFDARRLLAFRPRWFDIPMFVWTLSPLASSLSNGLGIYDGLSGVQRVLWSYLTPYVIGRLYVRQLEDLRALGRAMTIGALIYVPLCLYEIRFSPQLHHIVYGFHQHIFEQTRRFGGWRPTVFLQHGLAVGMWMCASTITAYGLSRAGVTRLVAGVPITGVVLATGATCVFCKSLGSVVLLAAGMFVLVRTLRTSSRRTLICLVLAMPCYLTARIAFDWAPSSLVEQAEMLDVDRAASLQVRLTSEASLRDRALEQPWFGWGGWNRFREGLPSLPTDSLWAITLGQRGFVGLVSLFGVLFLAQWLPLRRLRRVGVRPQRSPELTAMIVVVSLYSLDCLANAMTSPIYIAVAGGLVGWMPERPAVQGQAPRRDLPR